MPLLTWEEKYAALSRRVAQLELGLARVQRYAESTEALGDRVHHRQGELIATLSREIAALR